MIFVRRNLIFALFAAVGCAGRSDQQSRHVARTERLVDGSTRYTDDGGRFVVTYGPLWVRVDPPATGQVFSIRTPVFEPSTGPTSRRALDFGSLGITIQVDPESRTDDQTLHDVSAGIVDFVFNHGGDHVRIVPDRVGGVDARRVRFETGGKAAVCVVAVRNHVAVILDAAAPTDRFDRYLPAVQSVLDNLVVTGG